MTLILSIWYVAQCLFVRKIIIRIFYICINQNSQVPIKIVWAFFFYTRHESCFARNKQCKQNMFMLFKCVVRFIYTYEKKILARQLCANKNVGCQNIIDIKMTKQTIRRRWWRAAASMLKNSPMNEWFFFCNTIPLMLLDKSTEKKTIDSYFT